MIVRFLAGALTACMLLVVCCLPASAQPAAAHIKVSPDADRIGASWGDMVEGLQMHAEFDTTSLTVICRIRNGCTETVGYNDYLFGQYRMAWVEIKCDTGWRPVGNVCQPAISIGPHRKYNRSAQPGEVLPVSRRVWQRDNALQDTYTEYTTDTVVVCLKNVAWPGEMARMSSLEFRVGQAIFSTVELSRDWHLLMLRSSPIRINDAALIGRLAATAGEEPRWDSSHQ